MNSSFQHDFFYLWLALCVRGRKQVHFHQSSCVLWSATRRLSWQGMCVCRQDRLELLQLCPLCCHPGRGKTHPFPQSLGTGWALLVDVTGWEEDAQLLAVQQPPGILLQNLQGRDSSVFIEADQEKGLCIRGGVAGQAGLRPALTPCPPLTLAFAATDTQLEMSMWAVLPFVLGRRMTLIKCFVVVLGELVAEEVFMSSFGHVVQVRPDGDEGVLTATHSEEPWVRVSALHWCG